MVREDKFACPQRTGLPLAAVYCMPLSARRRKNLVPVNTSSRQIREASGASPAAPSGPRSLVRSPDISLMDGLPRNVLKDCAIRAAYELVQLCIRAVGAARDA